MRNPGFEDVLNGLVAPHPERDDKRAVGPLLPDLLGGEYLAPLEIVADPGVDPNGHLQALLPGEPDVGAPLEDRIEIFGNCFEKGFRQLEVADPVEGVALQIPGSGFIADKVPEIC